MKKIFNLLFLACVSIAFTACQNDDSDFENATGLLKLSVGVDVSTVVRDYDPTQIAVQVVDSDGSVVAETDDYTEWSSGVTLDAGTYTVNASSSGFDGDSGFDNAYYTGTADVTISAGVTTSTSITCTLANVKVTVNYSDEFLAAFTDVDVTVQDVDASYTAVQFTTDEERSAYFPVADLLVSYSVTNSSGQTNSDTYTISGVQARDHYIINFTVEEDATGYLNGLSIAIGSNNVYTYTFYVNPEDVVLSATLSDNAWATFAYLSASDLLVSPTDVEVPTEVSFLYRESGEEEWSSVEATLTDGVYEAKVTGLSDATEYEYKLASTDGTIEMKDESALTFTTEEATQFVNSSFEDWYQSGNYWYVTDEDSYNDDVYCWDTSNKGSALLGSSYNTTTSSSDYVVSGDYSAKLESKYVLVKFAAASLYYGRFDSANLLYMSAELDWGIDFVSRPTSFQGYYIYSPVEIGYVGSDQPEDTVEKGDMDLCAIYIALATTTYHIDSSDTSTFVDFENDDNIIAYGELPEEDCVDTGEEWVQFNIPLKYKTLTETPQYLIVVCSSSKYGDYFTGGKGSTLYLDDFELVYGDEPTLWE